MSDQAEKLIQDKLSGGNSWTRPDDESLRQEYKFEYEGHYQPYSPDVFPTYGHFKKAVDSAQVVKVTPEIDSKIDNRSHTQSFEDLHSLISTYRSYPEFRNKETLTALNDRIKTGKPTHMPIVFRHHTGRMRILSGNTRMDLAKHHEIHPEVLMVDLPKEGG